MLIPVRVIPRSSKNTLEWERGALKARLTAPPVEGAANEALIALLAEYLAVPKRAIRIVHGATSRQKTVEIAGVTEEEVERRVKEQADKK
jgi:uncharacterized protein (TIGR00251 family)